MFDSDLCICQLNSAIVCKGNLTVFLPTSLHSIIHAYVAQHSHVDIFDFYCPLASFFCTMFNALAARITAFNPDAVISVSLETPHAVSRFVWSG
jgi:hypothetical protein